MRLIVCLVMLSVACGLPLSASQIIGSPTGLTSPALTITFDEFPIAQDTAITNQYAGLGATFGPGVYYDPQPGPFSTHALGNYFINGTTTTPIIIDFTTPQTEAALQFVTNAGTTTFTAMLNGEQVDQFSAVTDISVLYYGFTGERFDSIRINVGESDFAAQFDNLQLGPGGDPPVPEPGTVALLGAGLFALAFLRKRSLPR